MSKYRLKTKILPEQNQYLTVKIDQNFDSLDILTLSIYGTDVYPNPCGDWGVVIGRVVDSNNFPMENVKIGYIIDLDEDDSNDITIRTIYNDIVGSKYPLLPKYKVNKNHFPVGGFPSEDEVMSNSALEYVYKKYFKYVASTNQNGDYVILGVPLGSGSLLMNFDSTDAGSLSTTPIQQLATGQKEQKDFKDDINKNNNPINANGGDNITGNTQGQTFRLGSLTGYNVAEASLTEVLLFTGVTANGFGGGSNISNKSGDNVSVIKKKVPNDGRNVDNTAGTLISRTTKIQVKSFFGDLDQCEIGVNRYDYKLDYKFQPCNYIIGSFYSDYNVFKSAIPTYSINNIALAASKQIMGGKVSFLLDGYDETNPDISADVAPDGTFYAAIPCKWDRYNIDEEGNWFKTNDDFTKNPTGIFTRTPYCLLIYTNNDVSVNMNDGKTYSRASAIGFNLNNNSEFIPQIGIDGSTGVTTINRFNIKYNAQYYPSSPFPNGYYNPINSDYYPYPKENASTKYRNGAELNWDYKNRRSNVYTIASQWSKYGYYSALSVENNGLSGGTITYSDNLKRSRFSPMPNLFSTKPLSTDIELITNITTNNINSANSVIGPNVLPLDDDGPYGYTPNNYKLFDLNTEYYPNGNIGRTLAANGGIDFNFTNYNNNIGAWGFGGTTNSYFQVNTGGAGVYKIRGTVELQGWQESLPDYAKYHMEIVIYRNGENIKVLEQPIDVTSTPNGYIWLDEGRRWDIDFDYYLQDNDIVYFNFHTERLNHRMSFRLQNTNINFYKLPSGGVYPLIVGNMYLPTFEAVKYDGSYYPVDNSKDILDSNNNGFNAPKLSEMDLMLYPITDEMFNIVEHSQINNPYENGTINYYFFCNQYWKLRDFIYNEIN